MWSLSLWTITKNTIKSKYVLLFIYFKFGSPPKRFSLKDNNSISQNSKIKYRYCRHLIWTTAFNFLTLLQFKYLSVLTSLFEIYTYSQRCIKTCTVKSNYHFYSGFISIFDVCLHKNKNNKRLFLYSGCNFFKLY